MEKIEGGRELNLQRVRRRQLGYRGSQVMALVTAAIAADQQMPSYRMICDELGIDDKGTVSRIVSRLEQRGLVTRQGVGRQPRIRVCG